METTEKQKEVIQPMLRGAIVEGDGPLTIIIEKGEWVQTHVGLALLWSLIGVVHNTFEANKIVERADKLYMPDGKVTKQYRYRIVSNLAWRDQPW